MIPWYNYSEEDRIEKVYSQFSIKDFWNWWSNNEQKVMEVRIKDFNIIKEVSAKYNLPYSSSGIYVWNDEQLKLIIGAVRNRATIWFGVNPRKRNYNKWGKKSFGGSDCNINEVGFIFIDIDRQIKNGPATSVELENCNKLSDLIIERLQTQGWNKSYIKICSGNGVQLLIKFDFPFKLPEIEYDSKNNMYIESKEYNKIKSLIRETIGKDIIRFCFKYKKDLGVEVDKSGFNIGRVAALAYTKNFKYNGFTWRGIVELQNGVNDGFSDYLLSKENDVIIYQTKAVFSQKSLSSRDRLIPGKLKNNILVKFMLEHELPYGMINNYLWFSFKCLLRDSKIDLHSEEFQKIHKQIEAKVKGQLPINLPDIKFQFDENIVNKYCIVNLIPPLYPLWPKRIKLLDIDINEVTLENTKTEDSIMELSEDTDILQDLEMCKKTFMIGMNNGSKFRSFILGCIKKYGEEKTKYYFDYIMKRYLSYE